MIQICEQQDAEAGEITALGRVAAMKEAKAEAQSTYDSQKQKIREYGGQTPYWVLAGARAYKTSARFIREQAEQCD